MAEVLFGVRPDPGWMGELGQELQIKAVEENYLEE